MNGETPKNKYISLAEATKYCNYSLPYLNLRIRQGKLKAVKFGRNWMTTRHWLGEYILNVEKRRDDTDTYMSLAEATKYCNYSLPYLNLRIRQGKLKAVKFGRNWMTKKEWLMDYLTRVEAYNNSNQTNHFEKEEIPPTGVSEKSVFGDEEKGLSSIPPAGVFQATQKIKKISFARIGYVSLIIMSLFIGSILLIEFGIGNDSQNFSGKTIETISNFSKTISGKTKILFASLEQKDNSGILKSSFGFLGKGFQKISLSLKSMFDFFKDGIALINKSYGKTAEGLIAFPATYNEDLKKKVQKLFSDEIRIGPIDKSSGHVIPVFKESDGDKYMYMLVPINN